MSWYRTYRVHLYNVEVYALCTTVSNYTYRFFLSTTKYILLICISHTSLLYTMNICALPVALFYTRKMSLECSEKFDVRELHYHHRLLGLIIWIRTSCIVKYMILCIHYSPIQCTNDYIINFRPTVTWKYGLAFTGTRMGYKPTMHISLQGSSHENVFTTGAGKIYYANILDWIYGCVCI